MLSITTSRVPHNCASPPTRSSRRSQVYGTNSNFHLATSKCNHKRQFLGNQKTKIFTTTLEVLHYGKNRKMDMTVYSTGVESGLPFPLPFDLPFDLNPGSCFELAVWTKVDSMMQTVEAVAETVEKVADKVDKVAEDFADSLPEGRVKQAARFIENIAEDAEKDAHLVDEAIEKIEEIQIELDKEAERFTQAETKTTEAQNG
ncbi:unnamed protein product [Dovyalis caffra]|uniref:Uncharacterized protein n=1 Tax=Dovyalis caffra TaxID=77055 RepID=A0AAV1S7C2_9ROSI|nr:unnamed protein product [Dovyalis caffra]